MTERHAPQWQTTDDDERPVHVTAAKMPSAKQQIALPQKASRMPAAAFGIIVFIALGFVFQQGLSNLTGQASGQEEFVIRITELGVVPTEITLSPGEPILFKNESSIPHIISAQTLIMENGKAMETTAIFPQSEETVQIPASIRPGIYPFISTTSTAISGSIIIVAPLATSSSVMSTTSSSGWTPSSIQTTSQYSDTTGSVVDATSFDTVNAAVIPQNPYTVGSGDIPLPSRNQPITTAPGTNVQANVTLHTPSSTAETGSALWVTGLMFAASLLFVWKRANS